MIIGNNGFHNGYEFVDLGLSVNWATFNVGATKPEEYGDYYAWGETETYYEVGYAQSTKVSHPCVIADDTGMRYFCAVHHTGQTIHHISFFAYPRIRA